MVLSPDWPLLAIATPASLQEFVCIKAGVVRFKHVDKVRDKQLPDQCIISVSVGSRYRSRD
jgi:hypothetical protein